MRYTTMLEGIPGTTVRIAVTDAVQQLAIAVLTLNNRPATAVIIDCEEEDARYAFNADPTQGVNPVGHPFFAGAQVVLGNGRLVREFRFINDVIATDAFLQVTPYFEIGAG